MAFHLEFGIWGSIFAVPTAIVDEHIQLCGSASLKVLLVLLRHSADSLELADVARLVGLSPADAQDALNYWLASGILKADAGEDGVTLGPGEAPSPPAAPELPPAQAVAEPRESGEQRVVKVTSRPRLTPEAIAQMAQSDTQVTSLIQEAQGLLGRPLSPSATETLISLHSYGGMSAELILMVIQYCVSIGKDSVRYIETTAYDWMDRGIDTFDKAEQHIRERTQCNEMEKTVRDAFGIRGRDLTSKEAEFAGKWVGKYGFGEAMLRLAYERTIDNKGKLSFPYCDGILSRWHEKGVKTPREAADEIASPPQDRPSREGGSYPVRPAYGTPSSSRAKYDRAHAELQNRRNAARDLFQKRRDEIYEKVPRIREIDATLAKTGFEVSKAVLRGGDTAGLLQSLKDKNLALQGEREDALLAAGYPGDYLEIPYHCKKCEDKGYRPDGEACDCLKELLS